MLQKTKGIALKVTNYSENSVVAQIFTEDLGLQSYLINGARKPKAKIHVNMLQPLHCLNLVVYVKDNGSLQRIKEASPSPTLLEIPLDIVKGSMAMFLNEVLYKVLKNQHADPHLFQYILQSIIWLDQTKSPIINFHLVFLMKLSRFLGYLPSTQTLEAKPYFDLLEGIFTEFAPAHKHVLQEPHTSIFQKILQSNFENSHLLTIKRGDRKYILNQIIDFYRLHTENFGVINSLQILEEIFH